VVVVQREVLPLACSWPERFAASRAQLVWDVDDAVWVEHDGMFIRGAFRAIRGGAAKYRRVATASAEVWAGSEELARWCRQMAHTVSVLPTVVDMPSKRLSRGQRSGVVWTGSPSTGPFLQQVLPQLAPVPAGIRVLGATVASERSDVVQEPWSEEAEFTALRGARVGLYPIDVTHPLAVGKAGFKAVLYMAHGLPCVVTPTPTVASLIGHEREGLHASDPEEWATAVSRLLEDDDLWDLLSTNALERASRFSVQTWFPLVVGRIAALRDQPWTASSTALGSM